jgi:Polyketide cyclase / dehydrase and lipid transport
MRRLLLGVAVVACGRRAYRFYASGAVTVDSGAGRRVRELGPVTWKIAADRETVFDVIASPYLGKTPRSMKDRLEVWERGTDMVLAAHYTKVKCGVTITVETVHFERPDRINFRLVRGPVPHVRETFDLEAAENGSTLTWKGELGTDYGALGALWGDVVARSWENAVRSSMKAITSEAERRFQPDA